MLTSTLGIRLLFWLGDVAASPAPRAVLMALTRVEVTVDTAGGDGFALTFALAKDNSRDYGLLASGALEPDRRVVIGVILGASPNVLIDGIIQHHQFAVGRDGTTQLVVKGIDLTTLMGREEKNAKFTSQADSDIVNSILGPYARYGIVPDVTTTNDRPDETKRIPRQFETDLALIRRLAQRNGFTFYLEPTLPGASRAHWGPRPHGGAPQPALTYQCGAADNLRSLSFANDALAPVQVEGKYLDPQIGSSLPIPGLASLMGNPLVAAPARALRTLIARDVAHRDTGQAALSLLSSREDAADAVTVEAEVDALRYGHVLAARALVGLRGAGKAYDGAYYVQRIVHSLTLPHSSEGVAGDYTQTASLSREGTGSLVGSLPT